MKSFKQYITEMKMLAEKALVIGKGANYGQIVFLAGGAGSGKGFAISNFLEGSKFKVRDVDEWKKAFLKIAVLKRKYPELRRLDLRRPDDVATLHGFVREKGIKDKTLTLMLSQAKAGRLPNIIFDITLKSRKDITKVLPQLMEVGYSPRDIHIVWVLTNYTVAVHQNKNRDRIVPDRIMLKTHKGAGETMWKFINQGTPATLDGSVSVILGGNQHTVYWKDKDGKPLDGTRKSKYGTDRVVIKDFKYITIKEPGKNMASDSALKSEVLNWIVDNVPKELKDKGMLGEELNERRNVPLPQLYVDMDEVLVDFLGGSEQILGRRYNDKSWKNSEEKKSLLTKKAPNFFRNLKWKKDGKTLWNYVKGHGPKILSAFPQTWMPSAKADKAQWIKKNTRLSSSEVHLVARADKQKYAVSETGQPNVLIDDHPKNIKEWQKAGGVGIVHRSASETISKLKKMGF